MPKQENTGLRARIPAAIASATAATVERAARLLDRASQAVPLRRVKNSSASERAASPTQSGPAQSSRDDTH